MKQHFRPRHHTLSGKMLLLFSVVALVTMVVVGGIMGWAFRMHMQERMLPNMELYLEYVQRDLDFPPQRENALSLAHRLNLDVHYLAEKGWSTGGVTPNLKKVSYVKEHRYNGADYGVGVDGESEFLVIKYPNYTLIFVAKRNYQSWHKVVVVLVVLFILMVLYHAIRYLFSPIKAIRDGVVRIGSGDLDYRLNIHRKDELGELGQSINAMADDIEQMLNAKRELLLAISHELRTPLTRAKVATEMLSDQQQREELHRELNEVEKLIEELLETERINQRHSVLNKVDTDLGRLIKTLVHENYAGQPIHVYAEDGVVLPLDAARIKLLAKNLIENALKHNPVDARPIEVSVSHDHKKTILCILDHGKGIEAEHVPHLTEPFYRADPARQRQTGGFGLGLYLCRVIAEAHGGVLSIESEPGKGTRVCVALD